MRKAILILIIFIFVFPVWVFAGELDKKSNTSSFSNIGFMKKPPKKLKEKFPMCDAFLKVDWIDREKKIGYSHYDLYRDGRKEKQKAFALIHLDESRPHYDYDLSVSEFEGVGKIGTKKIFSIIKKGKVFFNTNFLSIEFDNDEKRLDFDTIAGTRDVYDFTLADYRINVCIPYPDNQRVWIAEGKQIDKVYSKEEASKITAKIKTYAPSPFPLHGWQIGESWIVDLNFDGMEDYYSGGKIVYSYGIKYYDMKALWKQESDDTYGQWGFPPTQKICELKDPKEWVGGFFLTTDGKNFFLNNKCNLTELTHGGK
ncbi:MAG: hypothetical protein ABFD76_13165 [Smithella sp.]